MKAKIIAAAVVAAAALPAAANAEDFLGGRIGIVGGWDHVKVDVNNIGTTTNDYSGHTNGATFGLLTGYHWALSEGTIIGIGTSTTFSSNDKTFSRPGPTINPPPPGGTASGATNTLKLESKYDLEAHVKLGAVVTDYALIYAKVGVAKAKVKAEAMINGIHYEESDTGTGLALGAGTELSLNEQFSFVAEYRYGDYSKHIKRHQLLAGVVYKF